MKKITFSIIIICAVLALNPLQSNASTAVTPTSLTANKATESAEAKTLLLRLDEIKAMDKSNLKSSEKKVLRKEVRSIKQELNTMHQGAYISVGAIIIIALLLIILL